VFNVDDILDGSPDVVAVYEDGSSRFVKVWDASEYPDKVIERATIEEIQEQGIDFVIVHFNAPPLHPGGDPPPSNRIGYMYLKHEYDQDEAALLFSSDLEFSVEDILSGRS